jgi:hypothetical protein
MQVDLSRFGVTREVLINAVLSETGLSREDAVLALARELGVEIQKVDDYQPNVPVNDGDEVITTRGAGRAAILTESELETLRNATVIQQRLFS